MRGLLDDHSGLSAVRMIGRRGVAGGWRTPLHAATDWPGFYPGAPAAVGMLLDAGADPNVDCGGERPETALHWAASTDDVEVAEVLLDAGANLDTPGGSIGTPLDNAIGYSCWQVARLLVHRGAAVDKIWHAAALGARTRLDLLITQGRPNQEEVSQAFWHACAAGQRRTAESLLAHGADLNWVSDYADGTPLDAARTPSTGHSNLLD